MALPELIANSPTPGTVAFTTKLSAELKTGVTGAKALKVEGAAPTTLQGAGQAHFVIDKEIIVVDTGTTNTTEWTILQRKAEGSTEANHLVASNVYNLLSREALKGFIEGETHSVPAGGTVNQNLIKTSGADYATAWASTAVLPTGGTAGQALVRKGTTETEWKTITVAASAPGGWVDPITSFGAVGDGVANDTTAVQNAINSLPAGGVLFLRAGFTFSVTDLLLKADMTIIGYGATIVQQAAGTQHGTLKVNPSGAQIGKLRVYGLKMSSVSVNAESKAFELYRFSDVIIRDCWIENFKGGMITASEGNRIQILNNHVKSCCNPGSANVIDLCDGPAGAEYLIDGNTVVEAQSAQIAIATMKNGANPPVRAIITNNVVTGTNSWTCITVESGGSASFKPKAWDIIIANNQVNNSGAGELKTGILITSNGEVGSRDENTNANILITGNRIRTEKGAGIFVMGRRITIANNIVTTTTSDHVIEVAWGGEPIPSQEIMLLNNTLEIPATYETVECIYLRYVQGATIAGNRIVFGAGNTHAVQAIYATTGCKNLTIRDNVIENPPHYGINIAAAYENVQMIGNTIINPGQGTTKGAGIIIEGAASGNLNIIRDNVIVDNRGGGALMEVGIKTPNSKKELALRNIVEGATVTAGSGTFKKLSEATFVESPA